MFRLVFAQENEVKSLMEGSVSTGRESWSHGQGNGIEGEEFTKMFYLGCDLTDN